MRTIIINTTKEAGDIGLDFLFKAPFDTSSLLWIDTGLSSIKDSVDTIRESIFTQASLVDRDYKLIVLVNLCTFPRGDESVAASIYKALLTKYITHELIDRLAGGSFVPSSVSICYLEPSVKRISSERIPEKDDNGRIAPIEERTIKSLFGWDDDMPRDNVNWKLATSFDGEFIDMRDSFAAVDGQVKDSNADSKVSAVSLIIGYVISEIGKREDWEDSRKLNTNNSIEELRLVIFKLKTDNEQEYIEGYFSVFASMFKCVESPEYTFSQIEPLEHEKIEQLLKRAREKYKYYSRDDNIELKTEEVRFIVENRKELKEKFVDAAEVVYGLKKTNGNNTLDKIRNKVAEILGIKGEGKKGNIGIDYETFKTMFDEKKQPGKILALINDYKYKIDDNSEQRGGEEGIHGKLMKKQRLSNSIDNCFKALVEAIYENYDADRIKAQNKKLIDNCYSSFWDSRDKNSRATLLEYICSLKKLNNGGKTDSETQSKEELDAVKNGELHFHRADKQDDYNKLVEMITDVEHKICKNRDVLLETRSVALRYDDIKRRGRLGALAIVGGLIAVITAVLPYILIQGQSINSTIVHTVLYAVFTIGFAALYLISSIIFLTDLNKKKRALLNEAADLFAKSVWDRWDSAVAFYTFYAKTTVEAEAHKLIWSEIEANVEKNRRYCAERNNHKRRLEQMTRLVERFITRLKYSSDNSEAEQCNFDNCEKLHGNEEFCTEHNRKIYSILDETIVANCCDINKKDYGEEAE